MTRPISRLFGVAVCAAALLGASARDAAPVAAAAPTPAPSPTGRPVTMVCGSPLFIWGHGLLNPVRSQAGGVSLGQTFHVIKGPRTADNGTAYVQVDVPVNEVEYPNDDYWVFRECALPS